MLRRIASALEIPWAFASAVSSLSSSSLNSIVYLPTDDPFRRRIDGILPSSPIVLGNRITAKQVGAGVEGVVEGLCGYVPLHGQLRQGAACRACDLERHA